MKLSEVQENYDFEEECVNRYYETGDEPLCAYVVNHLMMKYYYKGQLSILKENK